MILKYFLLARIARILTKGSRKNKFTILGVEAPGWPGAKVQEYQVYSELLQHSQTGYIGFFDNDSWDASAFLTTIVGMHRRIKCEVIFTIALSANILS